MSISILFEGQELSNEFKEKATVIFESAVEEKVKEKEAQLQEAFEAEVAEKLESLDEQNKQYINEHIVTEIDKYLGLAIDEWFEENRIALEHGAKVELAESFLNSIVGLAETHNLSLPQSEFDKVKSLGEENSNLSSMVIESKEKISELKNEIVSFKRSAIVANLTETLTEVQKDKFKTVSEKVEFKTEDQFTSAIKSLIESYFPVNEKDDEDMEDKEDEKDDEEKEPVKESRDPYLSNLFKQLNA